MPNPAPAEAIDLTPDTLALLTKASTATVATLLFKRGYHNAYVQGALPLNADTGTMVGPAYTLRYIPTGRILIRWMHFANQITRSGSQLRNPRKALCW